MLWFFLTASLMVVAAVTLLVLPILRPSRTAVDWRDQQNIAIARERLAQLQQQMADGALDEDQAAQERRQIERALLDDVDSQNVAAAGEARGGGWAGVVVAVSIPFLAGVLYLLLGHPAAFTAAVKPDAVDAATAEGHSDLDLQAVIQGLESELELNPDNPQGWYLLGSTYMALQRFDEAAGAFEQLRKRVGDDPDILVRHADALAMANQGILAGEPEALLRRALSLDPDHPVGLWLAGIAADRRGDFDVALGYWRRAVPLFSDSPQSQAELEAQIARTESRLAGAGTSAAPPRSEASSPPGAVGNGAIEVRVSLSEELSEEVAGDETLFVLARAVTGPPMPLAVVRKRADDLPLVVTLDDGMAMVPGLELSSQEQVEVVAKLSRSGDAATRSGDLIGEVSPVKPGTSRPVNVVISKRAP